MPYTSTSLIAKNLTQRAILFVQYLFIYLFDLVLRPGREFVQYHSVHFVLPR